MVDGPVKPVGGGLKGGSTIRPSARPEAAPDDETLPSSKIYWPDWATKEQVRKDAAFCRKRSVSDYVSFLVQAARNPILFAELAAHFGTKVQLPDDIQTGPTGREKELEANLRHAEERREAAEAHLAEVQTRLEVVEAERAALLSRFLAEADLRESPIHGLSQPHLHGMGGVETPPTEAVQALDALTSKPGASPWASADAIIAHMTKKLDVPDAPTALSILRKAKRLDLVVDKRGQWSLTAQGRAMVGA